MRVCSVYRARAGRSSSMMSSRTGGLPVRLGEAHVPWISQGVLSLLCFCRGPLGNLWDRSAIADRAQEAPGRPQQAQGGPSTPQKAPGSPREPPGGPRRPLEGPGRPQGAPGGLGRPREAPGGPRSPGPLGGPGGPGKPREALGSRPRCQEPQGNPQQSQQGQEAPRAPRSGPAGTHTVPAEFPVARS